MPSSRVSLFPSTFAGTAVGEIEKLTRQRRLLGASGTLNGASRPEGRRSGRATPVVVLATTVTARGWSGR